MTWSVREVTARREALDFTSSGQGRYEALQILLDGQLFANAAGLTTWNDDRIQVLVCEACGIEHCEPGGWLTLRSAGTLRVFVPMFGEWNSEQDRMEYAPPKLVGQRGAPVFEPAVYGRFRDLISELPVTPPPITGAEARELLMFEAPSGLRLDDGRLELARRLAAADDHELEEAMDALLQVLVQLESSGQLMARPLTEEDEPIKLYLNDAAFSEWTPVALSKEGPRLLWGRWVVERASKAA